MNWLKSILSIFSSEKHETPLIYPGVLLDDRSEEAKSNDIAFGELVAKADPVIWKEVPRNEWPVYGSQNQNGQGSCVANSGRKVMRVMVKKNHDLELDFSSLDIYRRRANYPDAGMHAYDLWEVMKKGTTLGPIVPSDNFSEQYANSIRVPAWARQVGDTFKITTGVNLPIDIDTVASTMQRTGKAIVLFFFFTSEEWSREMPIVIDRTLRVEHDRALRHAVAGIIHTLANGKKAIVIDDSAHFGGLDRRIITEEFFKARCFYAGYPMRFVFDPEESAKPSHTFSRDIPFGENSDEVIALQDCLKYEGVFPSNVGSTGLYGATTAAAVLAFQKKYAVAPIAQLEQLAGRNVGPATRTALNTRFA